MKVNIDEHSGYCFGVEYAINMAEDELRQGHTLYCLGDIVHNSMEVERLNKAGMKTINHEELANLKDCKVMIRAHGEPPETYKIAMKNGIELVDASCPVVLKLQNRIKNAYDMAKKQGGQLVIYGKPAHAEVVGLNGQIENNAIIVSDTEDINQIDFQKPIILFSQTTKSTSGFKKLITCIQERIKHTGQFSIADGLNANDSICRQVSNREPQLKQFANQNDVILFVAGKKSSNGKALYQVCLSQNPKSYFIESETKIDFSWFQPNDSVGICGATSTPQWLMKQIVTFLYDQVAPQLA